MKDPLTTRQASNSSSELPLHEEVMLLALRDKEGKIDSKAAFYPQIIASAILAELLLNDALKLSKDKHPKVEYLSKANLDDNVLYLAATMVQESKKTKDIKHWIGRFAAIGDLKNKIARSLCEKGILTEKEVSVFWVFSATRFPEANPSSERELIARLKTAIFTSSQDVDIRTATLISILKPSSILQIPFEKSKLNARKARIEALCDGSLVCNATQEVIQAIQTALIVASIMPAITVAVG